MLAGRETEREREGGGGGGRERERERERERDDHTPLTDDPLPYKKITYQGK